MVFAACAEDWRSRVGIVSAVLPAARGSEGADLVLDRMPADDIAARVTGLRLLRSLAPKHYAGILAVYLDHEQSNVKKEAINALRVVVDDDPPLENLSVFQAIELAQQWRARL